MARFPDMTLVPKNSGGKNDGIGSNLKLRHLGHILQAERKNRKLSQQRLLDAMREETGLVVNVQKWSRIENGIQEPPFSYVIAFCMVCGGKDAWESLLLKMSICALPDGWEKRQSEIVAASEVKLLKSQISRALETLNQLSSIADDIMVAEQEQPDGCCGAEGSKPYTVAVLRH